jgi:LPS-assembly lipoprotein
LEVQGRRGVLRGAAALLALGAGAVVGGCGFRPIYSAASPATPADAEVAADLAATRVPVIPNRFGQLLRRALVQRLSGGTNGAATARWELLVGPGIAGEAVGIQRDGSATRVRNIATANWTLVRLAPREVVANGFERAIDAFNIEGSQFFAADASRDAMERRLAEQLAEEVVVRLALQFRTLRDGAAPQRIEPVQTPPPMPEPTIPAVPGGLPVPGSGEGVGGPTGGIGARDGLR